MLFVRPFARTGFDERRGFNRLAALLLGRFSRSRRAGGTRSGRRSNCKSSLESSYCSTSSLQLIGSTLPPSLLPRPSALARFLASFSLVVAQRRIPSLSHRRSYHTFSVNSINSTVRRYNVVAPYSARRGLHSVNAELAACVKSCIPAISWELQRRLDGGRVTELPERKAGEKEEGVDEPIVEQKAADDRFWPALRRGVFELLGVGVERGK